MARLLEQLPPPAPSSASHTVEVEERKKDLNPRMMSMYGRMLGFRLQIVTAAAGIRLACSPRFLRVKAQQLLLCAWYAI